MKDVSELVPGRKYKDEYSTISLYVGLDQDGDPVFQRLSDSEFEAVHRSGLDTYEEYVEPRTGSLWINLYDITGLGQTHLTKESADKCARNGRIACIEVHWKEGQGL